MIQKPAAFQDPRQDPRPMPVQTDDGQRAAREIVMENSTWVAPRWEQQGNAYRFYNGYWN